MAYIEQLPRDIRNLLKEYATSGPYWFSRLPRDTQNNLLPYLPPVGIRALAAIDPGPINSLPFEFWTDKFEREVGEDGYDIGSYDSYMLAMLAFENKIPIRDRDWNLYDITWSILDYAGRTRQLEYVDELIRLKPHLVLESLGGQALALDYIWEHYPQYRLPLILIDVGEPSPNEFLQDKRVSITADDLRPWKDILFTVHDEYEAADDAIDSLPRTRK